MKKCHVVDLEPVLKEVGNRRALNIVMLGMLSNYLEFGIEDWKKAIGAQVKERFLEMNLMAFNKGREVAAR